MNQAWRYRLSSSHLPHPGRRQLRTGHLAEFTALDGLAGLLAATGTECLAWVLYSEVLHLEHSFQWRIWIIAPIAGALLIGVAGYWGTRTRN